MSKIIVDGDPNLSNKVLDEKETRKRILKLAREMGCEKEMLILFEEFRKLTLNCTNEKEKQDMGKLYAWKAWALFNRGGELYVDGELVAKDT